MTCQLIFEQNSSQIMSAQGIELKFAENHWWPPIKFVIEGKQNGDWKRIVGVTEIKGG